MGKGQDGKLTTSSRGRNDKRHCRYSNAEDLENKQNLNHHGIAACTCIDKVNTAVPVTTRASARSVWERGSDRTSGARSFSTSQLFQLYLLFDRTVCTWLVYRFQLFFVRP